MKKTLSMVTVLGCSTLLASVPTIVDSSVTLSQAADRTVTVRYTLEVEPAIVTLDVETNGVSIGGELLTYLNGDVNRKVEPGERTITWRPDKAWPGIKLDSGVKAVVKAWATNAPPNYVAVNLLASDTYRFYETAASVPGGVTNDIYKTEWLLMRKIPSANVQWRMGSPSTEPNRNGDELPRLVTLSNDYYIGVYELTQRQYELVYGERAACNFDNIEDYATRPVEKVSWVWLRGASGYGWPGDGHRVDSTKFLGKLRTLAGNRMQFDLPTEALWEFACRAGRGEALNSGKACGNYSNDPNANEIARGKFGGGCGVDGTITDPATNCRADVAGTGKVGMLKPNAWGLYDMCGNVYEFCLDWYKSNLSDVDPEVGPATGEKRVARGGCWNSEAFQLRSAYRANPYMPDSGNRCFGFRICAPAGID